jgi:hypothetical protein
MNNHHDSLISEDLLSLYDDLNKQKKHIENQLEQIKKIFHSYFDNHVGKNKKGEIQINRYMLQRQIRISEKFNDEKTVQRLEDLKMHDLIKMVKKPDETKIHSAINLNFLREEDLAGCILTNSSQAIFVKQLSSK